MQITTSNILYVRAGIKPFIYEIEQSGGIIEFLKQYFVFDEIFAPHFFAERFFWKPVSKLPKVTNSGALGKMISNYQDAIVSRHPSNSFTGLGQRVVGILKIHDFNKSCFYPVSELAARYDFSMLLIGCVDKSPGFSTVHAVQFELGLTQKHLFRYLLRWDIQQCGIIKSIIPKESPGCSLSLGKFYPAYENDGNIVQKELLHDFRPFKNNLILY